jgi:integrase
MPKESPQNRNKAQRILNAKIDDALKNLKCSKITLSELLDIYITNQKLTYKLSTTSRNERIIKSVIKLLGADVIVDNLTSQYLNEQLLNSGKPVSTLNTYITRFRAMLNWGYKNDYHDNYRLLSKLELIKDTSPSESTEDKYLEPSEINMLLDYISDQGLWHWYYATNMLLLTGMRCGELIALSDKDVDLKNCVIHVSKTYDYINKVVTTPKTDNSVRDIHIQPELALSIKKCRIWRRQMLLEKGFKSTLFLPDIHSGSYMSYTAFNKFISETTERELKHRITLHKLRHTHASLLAESGMTPDQIARRLGHSHSDVTQDIYIHATRKVIENDNVMLDSINLIS